MLNRQLGMALVSLSLATGCTSESDNLAPDVHQARQQQVQPDAPEQSELLELLSAAAAMPADAYDEMMSSDEAPDPSSMPPNLTNEVCALEIGLLVSENSDERPLSQPDFEWLGNMVETPRPAALNKALARSRSRGYVSILQPEDVTDCHWQQQDNELEGDVSFEHDGLFRGSVHFHASYRGDNWQVDSFELPGNGIHIRRNSSGLWEHELQGRPDVKADATGNNTAAVENAPAKKNVPGNG